jgi:assimilatory nitrate reductase catalytic subunit
MFALSGHTGAGNPAYEAMEPLRWGAHPFADGKFSTPDRKARLLAVRQATLTPAKSEWPLVLNSGRYRDQWHTMTRSGMSAKLARHRQEPLVEIHPADASTFGIEDGDLARVTTAFGSTLYRAAVTQSQRRGEMFAPIHWTDQQSSGGRTGLLAQPLTDRFSGQPGFKATPARIEPQSIDWRGFLVVHGTPAKQPESLWWTRITVPWGILYELAGLGGGEKLMNCLPSGERVEVTDTARGNRRTAVLRDGTPVAALFVTRSGVLPSRDWIISQLGQEQSAAVLAGRAAGQQPDKGTIVCVCFDVGAEAILRTIAGQRLTSVAEVGAALNAGTNCGSCRPAIAKLLSEAKGALNAA